MLKAFLIPSILMLFAFLLEGCSSQDIQPSAVDAGQDFYPVQVGNTWIYQADTIRYSTRYVTSGGTFITDTLRGTYFVKEIIADSIGLQEGNPFFRVELYHGADSTGPWTIDSVWSIQRGKDKILKTENNRPVVKLMFPLREGSRWDGNQYNSLQDSSGSYWFKAGSMNREMEFRNRIYPSVLITQRSDSSCLGKTLITETYLRGIGPAFIRKTGIIYSQDGPDPCGSIPKIESGKERTFTLLRFEKNI